MIDRDVFNYYKFKNSYNIIGDFDFIIRASLKFKIGCIQEPLAYYRIHNSNYSEKKMDLQINEHKHWILKNEKVMKNFSISIDSLKKRILKLSLKKLLEILWACSSVVERFVDIEEAISSILITPIKALE